jgi:hypothetical protein
METTTTNVPTGVPARAAQHTVLLRLEGLALLVAAATAYQWMQHSSPGALGWGLFAALFLVPDLAMLGFLRSPTLGTLAYNLAHTETLPALLLGVALLVGSPPLGSAALIWLAHVGFDRAVGYGLKIGRFNATHLGLVGRG